MKIDKEMEELMKRIEKKQREYKIAKKLKERLKAIKKSEDSEVIELMRKTKRGK